MTTEYYSVSGAPGTSSAGSSATMRAEFLLVEAGFAKMPALSGNGSLPVFINAAASGMEAVSAATARSRLGISIGSSVQAWDADLDAIAALTSAADKLPYATGAQAWAMTTFTAAARALLDDANSAAMLVTLGAAASGANTDITSVYLSNTGLKVKDTNASHGLSFVPGSDLTADRTLTFNTGDANATVAMLTVEDQALTGGVIVTSKDLGTVSSGTVTPDPGDRPQQHYTNGGAHTLGVSANAGSILVDITNNGSAGAITTSGFTKVTGDPFTTTNGNKFRCSISIGNGGSLLMVQALQ